PYGVAHAVAVRLVELREVALIRPRVEVLATAVEPRREHEPVGHLGSDDGRREREPHAAERTARVGPRRTGPNEDLPPVVRLARHTDEAELREGIELDDGARLVAGERALARREPRLDVEPRAAALRQRRRGADEPDASRFAVRRVDRRIR